ncbi:MAG: hypothetical protein HWE13_04625 [Gammaproteobacteria bacterium]|nr:hypothetical protein [Gammaproteobacteria bacterium]NVK87383.1 hypothetical protein [Gammaproteobacteria bacterium]
MKLLTLVLFFFMTMNIASKSEEQAAQIVQLAIPNDWKIAKPAVNNRMVPEALQAINAFVLPLTIIGPNPVSFNFQVDERWQSIALARESITLYFVYSPEVSLSSAEFKAPKPPRLVANLNCLTVFAELSHFIDNNAEFDRLLAAAQASYWQHSPYQTQTVSWPLWQASLKRALDENAAVLCP